ncbi:hypothetical protein [uncultured Thiodictyon sp.]|uniref:hypothetical protein n=1 Tax=uncultured Thiodictyon sp. TaxID=1846217 RepID=UPI0025DFEB7A|nr:hypothetical protein [uncultured Thiodictyon sp.]
MSGAIDHPGGATIDQSPICIQNLTFNEIAVGAKARLARRLTIADSMTEMASCALTPLLAEHQIKRHTTHH